MLVQVPQFLAKGLTSSPDLWLKTLQQRDRSEPLEAVLKPKGENTADTLSEKSVNSQSINGLVNSSISPSKFTANVSEANPKETIEKKKQAKIASQHNTKELDKKMRKAKALKRELEMQLNELNAILEYQTRQMYDETRSFNDNHKISHITSRPDRFLQSSNRTKSIRNNIRLDESPLLKGTTSNSTRQHPHTRNRPDLRDQIVREELRVNKLISNVENELVRQQQHNQDKPKMKKKQITLPPLKLKLNIDNSTTNINKPTSHQIQTTRNDDQYVNGFLWKMKEEQREASKIKLERRKQYGRLVKEATLQQTSLVSESIGDGQNPYRLDDDVSRIEQNKYRKDDHTSENGNFKAAHTDQRDIDRKLTKKPQQASQHSRLTSLQSPPKITEECVAEESHDDALSAHDKINQSSSDKRIAENIQSDDVPTMNWNEETKKQIVDNTLNASNEHQEEEDNDQFIKGVKERIAHLEAFK